MGRRTSVGTSISRIVEDDLIPDVVENSVIESILKGTRLTETLMTNILNSPANRYERAYEFAERGDYYYGLPNSTITTNTTGYTEVQAAIETEIGSPINLVYMEYAPPNHIHLGWADITANQGYDIDTNELVTLSGLKGSPVYLDKIVPVYKLDEGTTPDLGVWQSWQLSSLAGPTPERVVTGNTALPGYIAGVDEVDSVQIHYVWEDAGTIQKESYTISLTSYDHDIDHFHARYTYDDGGNTKYAYWIYEDGAGTLPSVDAIYDTDYVNPGTYFPFIVFRANKSNLADESYQGSERYESTVKLLEYFDADYTELSNAIHINPDIADVEQAVMLMAVPMNSEDQLDLTYVYDFFLRLYAETPFDEADGAYRAGELYNEALNSGETTQGRQQIELPRAAHSITIRDEDFKVILRYGAIIKKVRAGNIGEVGFITHETNTVQYATSNYETSPSGHVSHPSSGINAVYKRQIAVGFYEELTIIDPSLYYGIYRNYGTTFSVTSDQMLIPLNKNITDDYRALDKGKLYHRSLHFVFNSRITQNLEWYESGIFKAIIVFAAVVFTIITLGKGFPVLVAAFGIGLAIVVFLLNMLIEYLIVKYVFTLVVKELGTDIALTLAIVAMAYGISNQQGWGVDLNATWGKNLLSLSSGLMKAIDYVNQDAIADLLEDNELLETTRAESYTKLEKAQDLLSNNGTLNPLLFVERMEPLTIFGETSAEYYDRTIHTGNVGIAGIQVVETFVEGALTLPDFNQTTRMFT